MRDPYYARYLWSLAVADLARTHNTVAIASWLRPARLDLLPTLRPHTLAVVVRTSSTFATHLIYRRYAPELRLTLSTLTTLRG
jgi:hypothetical protein